MLPPIAALCIVLLLRHAEGAEAWTAVYLVGLMGYTNLVFLAAEIFSRPMFFAMFAVALVPLIVAVVSLVVFHSASLTVVVISFIGSSAVQTSVCSMLRARRRR